MGQIGRYEGTIRLVVHWIIPSQTFVLTGINYWITIINHLIKNFTKIHPCPSRFHRLTNLFVLLGSVTTPPPNWQHIILSHHMVESNKQHLTPRKTNECPMKINGWSRCISYWNHPFLGDECRSFSRGVLTKQIPNIKHRIATAGWKIPRLPWKYEKWMKSANIGSTPHPGCQWQMKV